MFCKINEKQLKEGNPMEFHNHKRKGLFDYQIHEEMLADQGCSLDKLNKKVNWELFRPELLKGLNYKFDKVKGGRPDLDPVLMFKIVFRRLLFTEIYRKIIWSILLYLLFIFFYSFTQNHINYPVNQLPFIQIDKLIEFDQRWSLVYLSICVFIGFWSLTISSVRDFYFFTVVYFSLP